MGLIQELVDLASKLTFVAIVHEYEQSLYFRSGVVIEKAIKGFEPSDLAQIKAEEQKVQNDIGRIKILFGLRSSKLPEDFINRQICRRCPKPNCDINRQTD